MKIDRGGIRDIEFLVQCLQRVYGGSESWLRSRGTMFALQKLYDKEHISGKDFHNLTNAYEFLRNLEHRLQLRHGQQTHRLPQSRWELQSLARSLTREGTSAPTPEEFLAHVQAPHGGGGGNLSASHLSGAEPGPPRGRRNFELQPEIPATPENSYSQMMQRLAVDSPRLREIAGTRRAVATCTAQSRSLSQFGGNHFRALWRGAALARSGGAGAHHLRVQRVSHRHSGASSGGSFAAGAD